MEVDQCLGHVAHEDPRVISFSFLTSTALAPDRRDEEFQIVGDPMGFISCSASQGTLFLSYDPTMVVAQPGERLHCLARDGTDIWITHIPRRVNCGR